MEAPDVSEIECPGSYACDGQCDIHEPESTKQLAADNRELKVRLAQLQDDVQSALFRTHKHGEYKTRQAVFNALERNQR